jgi:hypothetical protein
MSNYTKTTNFGAKDTLPSGDSQKIIRGTEFDTEFNNVATAIATKLEVDGSNNLAISGTFSSTKLIPTGGTATGNGMYLPAANAVAISTNGTERLRIDSSGVASFASNPILNGGTANGLVYLDGSKVATSGSAVTFDGTNLATTGTASATKLIPTGGTATGNGMYLPAANTVALSTNGTERVRVDSSGNLGVGTASPGAKLDIGGTNNTVFFKNSGATTGYALAAVSNTGGAFQYGISSSTGTFWGSGNAGNYSANIGTTTATNLGFGTNDTLRMLLDSSGNLGVGVTPSAWNSATKNIQNPAGSLFSINTTDSGVSQNLFLDSTGTWKYVNTAAASYFAQSSGSFVWTSVGSGTAGATASLTTKMTLDAAGNLTVGQSTSNATLADAGYVSIKNTANTSGFDIGLLGGSSDINAFIYQRANGYLAFGTNNAERARIDSSGNFSVGITTTPTQITFAGSSGITYQRSTDNSFSGVLDYLKSRGSAASPTVVQNGDGLFTLRIAPYHGSAYTYLTSQVVEVDGTFTSGQNPPTRIAWYTNAANGSSSERARIKSTGQFRFVPLSSDPSGAESGDVYYNSTSNKLKVYNGTSWVDLH